MNLEKLISDFLETGGKIKKCRTATAKGSKVLKKNVPSTKTIK